jgi:hypothetical protein
MTNHLSNIATRQRSSRFRDVIFAACVALATVVSISSVSMASNVANTHLVQH